jgi:hypothetical protein
MFAEVRDVVVDESSGLTDETAKSVEPDTAACKEVLTNREAIRMTRTVEYRTRVQAHATFDLPFVLSRLRGGNIPFVTFTQNVA